MYQEPDLPSFIPHTWVQRPKPNVKLSDYPRFHSPYSVAVRAIPVGYNYLRDNTELQEIQFRNLQRGMAYYGVWNDMMWSFEQHRNHRYITENYPEIGDEVLFAYTKRGQFQLLMGVPEHVQSIIKSTRLAWDRHWKGGSSQATGGTA